MTPLSSAITKRNTSVRSAVWGREGEKGGGGCKPSRSDGSATGSEIFFFGQLIPVAFPWLVLRSHPVNLTESIRKLRGREGGRGGDDWGGGREGGKSQAGRRKERVGG